MRANTYMRTIYFLIFLKIHRKYTLYINQSIKKSYSKSFSYFIIPVIVCMLYVCLYVTTYVSSATPRSTTGNPCSRSWAISVVLLLSLILPSCKASSGSTNCQTGTHNYQIINVENVY